MPRDFLKDARDEYDVIVIGSGLADGDQIIVSGLQMARPGMKVNPKPAGQEPPVPANATNAPAQPASGS